MASRQRAGWSILSSKAKKSGFQINVEAAQKANTDRLCPFIPGKNKVNAIIPLTPWPIYRMHQKVYGIGKPDNPKHR